MPLNEMVVTVVGLTGVGVMVTGSSLAFDMAAVSVAVTVTLLAAKDGSPKVRSYSPSIPSWAIVVSVVVGLVTTGTAAGERKAESSAITGGGMAGCFDPA